jgi:hypothetical protein
VSSMVGSEWRRNFYHKPLQMRVPLPVSTAVAPFREIVQAFQRKFREEAT